jgi:hypothetical protein
MKNRCEYVNYLKKKKREMGPRESIGNDLVRDWPFWVNQNISLDLNEIGDEFHENV